MLAIPCPHRIEESIVLTVMEPIPIAAQSITWSPHPNLDGCMIAPIRKVIQEYLFLLRLTLFDQSLMKTSILSSYVCWNWFGITAVNWPQVPKHPIKLD